GCRESRQAVPVAEYRRELNVRPHAIGDLGYAACMTETEHSQLPHPGQKAPIREIRSNVPRAARTSEDGRGDSMDDPLAADCAHRDHAEQDAAQVNVPGTTGDSR